MKKLLITSTIVACLFVSAAQAHKPRIGPHGGEVQTHNGQTLEAVLTSGKLDVYVSGAGSRNETSLPAAHALIIFVDQHDLRKAALKQTRPGLLQGKADFTVPAKGRVWVILAWRSQDGSMEQTIFEPLAK